MQSTTPPVQQGKGHSTSPLVKDKVSVLYPESGRILVVVC